MDIDVLTVLTVLGPVDADSLGITLPHEHLLHDSTGYYIEPTDPEGKKFAHKPDGEIFLRSHHFAA